MGTLSNIPGLIFVMTQVIFSPLSWGEGMAMRSTLFPYCETAGKGGKTIIIHFCTRQERRNSQETNLSSALCAECPRLNLAKYTYSKRAQPLFCGSLSLKSKNEVRWVGISDYTMKPSDLPAVLCGPVGSVLLFPAYLLLCLLVMEVTEVLRVPLLPPTLCLQWIFIRKTLSATPFTQILCKTREFRKAST